jgi:hypothetical protein
VRLASQSGKAKMTNLEQEQQFMDLMCSLIFFGFIPETRKRRHVLSASDLLQLV